MSDSTTHPNADEEWEELLGQWRSQPQTQPRPYFYTRVRARIDRETATARPTVRAWLRWPAYAVMLGALLLLSGDDVALRSASGPNQHSADRMEAQLPGD